MTVGAMIGKAASGSQQRQFVVSVDTAQLGTESQAGERQRLGVPKIEKCQPKLIRWVIRCDVKGARIRDRWNLEILIL